MDFPKIAPLPWTYEFGDHDGYDCMTAAFTICDAEGRTIIVLDVKDFSHVEPHPGQKTDPRDPDYHAIRNRVYEWEHRRSPAAEAMAQWLCAQANAKKD